MHIMNEILHVSIPLDEDGFLRRECPECQREFKLQVTSDEESEHTVEKLFCPYCGASATLEHWHTKAQVAYFQDKVFAEVIYPQLGKLENSLRRLETRDGLFSIKVDLKKPPKKTPQIAPESNDMRLVRFTCCGETIKILEDWEDQIHCVICGNTDFAQFL